MGSLADLFVTVRPDVNRVYPAMRKSGEKAGATFNTGFLSRARHLARGAAVGLLIGAGAAMGAALNKGFGRLQKIDDAEKKLRGLGHSAKETQTIMDSALKAVKGTAFGLDEAATVAASAVAAGIKPGKDLEKELRLVADAATIGGSSMGDMGRIFNQVATSNKVYNDTLNELGDRGIPIVQLLAKEMHVSAGQVRDLASAGEINFATFRRAMEAGVGGAALASGKTFTGAWKNMMAAVSRFGAAFLKPIFGQAITAMGPITKAIDAATPAAQRAGEFVGRLVKGARGLYDLFVKGDFTKNFHQAFQVPQDSALVDRLFKIRDLLREMKYAALNFIAAFNGDIEASGAGPKWMTTIINAGEKLGQAFDLIKLKVKVFIDSIWDPPALDSTSSVFAQMQGPAFSLKDTLVGLVNFVRTNFVPGLKAIAGFITGTLIPAWIDWYTFLASNFAPILQRVITFVRDNFMPAFHAVAGFIVTQVVPAFLQIKNAVLDLLRVVIPIISQIVSGILDKFGEMGPQVKSIWTSMKEIITGVMFIIKEVIQAVTFIIGGIWSRWGDQIMKVVKTIFGGMVNIIAGVMKVIAGIIKLAVALIKGDWSGAWNAIKQIFAGVWQAIRGILSVVTAIIRASFEAWLTKLKSLWHSGMNAILKTGKDIMTSLKDAFNTALSKIRDGFKKGVGAIGKAWDGVRGAAKKPVEFVINTVLDKGILGAVRSISGVVGFGPGKDIHVGLPAGWAHGTGQAVLPGYTPGRDVHRFFSPSGGIIDMSGGEGIIVPQLAKQIGKQSIEYANAAAMHGKLREAQGYMGGFALGSGGFLGGQRPVPPGWTHRHSGYSWARWAGDLQASMNTPVHAWKSGIIAAVRYLTTSYGRHIIENAGGSRVYYAHLNRAVVHAGQRVNQGQLIGYSDSTGNSTGPHLHFEIRGGSAPIGSVGGGGIGSIMQALSPAKWLKMISGALGKLSQIEDSPFGQMVSSTAKWMAGGVKSKIKDLASSFMVAVKGAAGAAFTKLTGGNNRSIGRRMMLQRWSIAQWPALNSLWTKESGWNEHARNPSSGAYGIPQALPGSKMASAGSDWRSNPATQIKWGLGYIASRYGSPAAAWRHSQRTNWYGGGGVIDEPVFGVGLRTGDSYGLGESGKELVTPLQRSWPMASTGTSSGRRPLQIRLDLGEDLKYYVQGMIDDNDQFNATMGRLSR